MGDLLFPMWQKLIEIPKFSSFTGKISFPPFITVMSPLMPSRISWNQINLNKFEMTHKGKCTWDFDLGMSGSCVGEVHWKTM